MGELNFGDLFEAVARAVPDRPALIHGDRVRTWAEFDARSNRLARHLIACGLAPGAKVAFYLRNSPAYLELLAACFKARLVHVNVNYRYVDAELAHILGDSDAELVVYDAEFRPRIEALDGRMPGVRGLLEHGTGPDDAFERACTEGDAAPLGIERSGDDLYFMYTGGTTGHPKAVMWPHAARIEVIGMASGGTPEAHARAVAATEPTVALPACPLMHSTGFTTAVSALCAGGCIVLASSPKFDPVECLRLIERHRVTLVALVGDAFSVPILEALRAPGAAFDLSSVTTLSSAGTMWSAPSKRGLLEYFPNATLRDSLGSSEGSRLAGSAMRAGEETATGLFTIGPGAKVFDEHLREVEPGSGVPGMIATCGPIPLGYYKDPERTAKTFPVIDGVRWSIPGDWCTVEVDGTIQLLGRGSHCINSGGEKIYPEEVEEALKMHPDVTDAAVFGTPDPRWGQAVCAVVQLRPDAPEDVTDLRAHLAPLLAAYKHPKRVVAVRASFRADNGKMDYGAAKAMFAAAAGESAA